MNSLHLLPSCPHVPDADGLVLARADKSSTTILPTVIISTPSNSQNCVRVAYTVNSISKIQIISSRTSNSLLLCKMYSGMGMRMF